MFNTSKHALSLITAVSFLSFSANAFAADDKRLEPLHLKITPSTLAQSSALKITSVQKKDIAPDIDAVQLLNTRPDNLKDNTKTPLVQESSPKQIKPMEYIAAPCSMDHIKTSADLTNRPDKLIDSLKLYIQGQNRNPDIIDALHNASQKTNISFELLVMKAMIESDLGRVTQSKTSSARGVFQYIEPTWIVLMKRYGNRIGYSEYADSIKYSAEHKKHMVQSQTISRQDVLDLRENPRIAALIKGYQIQDEVKILAQFKNGARVNATDHYIAHMLGLTMARKFYEFQQTESPIILANLKNRYFSEAVSLNRSFFYDKTGNGLNAAQAYQAFHKRMSDKFLQLRTIENTYNKNRNNILPVAATQSACKTPSVKTISAQAKPHRKKSVDLSAIDKAVKQYKIKIAKN